LQPIAVAEIEFYFADNSPTLQNFEVAGWNEPANQTGGDYFDWQSLPDGRLAISLGDATGHGMTTMDLSPAGQKR
jgi:hypothetical protein